MPVNKEDELLEPEPTAPYSDLDDEEFSEAPPQADAVAVEAVAVVAGPAPMPVDQAQLDALRAALVNAS